MSKNKKDTEPKNPYGIRHCDFIEKYNDIKHIAEICWYFGVQPEELKKEIEILMEKYNAE